jgi:Family of unknown function (DUF6152)
MGTHRIALKAAAGLLLAAMPTLAHHSFMAEYDESRLITLSGTVTKVYWKNPHVTFDLDVKDGSGKPTSWELELGSPNALLSQGWKVDSLKQGTRVAVTGFGARNGSHLANAIKVVLGGTVYSAIRDENRSRR